MCAKKTKKLIGKKFAKLTSYSRSVSAMGLMFSNLAAGWFASSPGSHAGGVHANSAHVVLISGT